MDCGGLMNVQHAKLLAISFVLFSSIFLNTLPTEVGAVEKIMNGTSIPQSYSPGCGPALYPDFMDTGVWDIRRVEPRDCSLLKISTPIFSWPLPLDISTTNKLMTLIITRPDGTSLSRTTLIPRLLFPNSLTAGSYRWKVQYINKLNQPITSSPRRFTIASGTLFSLPSGATLANTVAPKPHPRALPTGGSFATIASRLTGEYKPSYTAFIAKANTYLNVTPPSQPIKRDRSYFATDAEYNAWLNSLHHTAAAEHTAIETLGYAALITGNTAYESAGVARLMALKDWDPDGCTSESFQDQANRKIYLALAQGLDLYSKRLVKLDKDKIVVVLKKRLSPVITKIGALDRYPYDSHLLTATVYATETLMHVAGLPEFPEAKGWLVTSWEAMMTMAGAWGGMTDGGYANGTAYGWFTMTTLARAIAAIRLVANVNLSSWAPFGRTGDNQIAVNTPNALMMGQFGDGIDTNRHYFDYSWQQSRLLSAVSRAPEYEWYWRADPRNVSLPVALEPYHYLLLGSSTPPLTGPAAVPAIANSYLFEDAGYVAMHSRTTDALRSSVFFRSSRFGSYNHSHADNNAFTFVSKGKELLISGGYYPWYNSNHHALVGRATRFKNALTFNGGIGQAEPSGTPSGPGAPLFSMEARGKLINFDDNGTWAITTGDATLAYRGRLKTVPTWTQFLNNAVRTVAYNRQWGIVVIYDWATSTTPRAWELNFQSMNLASKISERTIQVANGTSKACLYMYGPLGRFDFSTGFPVAPESGNKTPQSRAIYKITTPSTQLVSVTVIRENCTTSPLIGVSFIGTNASVSINNEPPLKLNGRTVIRP